MQAPGYPVREAHQFIWVWWGEPQDEYPPPPSLEGLEDGFSYARDKSSLDGALFTRHRNQLDVFHLAFVHATTIGRGNRTISDGPAVRLNGEQMDIWVQNKMDDGSIALNRTRLLFLNEAPRSNSFSPIFG